MKTVADLKRLPLWKSLLFASLAFILFFGLLELLLGIFGVQPYLSREDPYVGFARNVPLYSAVTRKDGTVFMRTAANKIRFFNYQEFPEKKGKNTYRIFCLGGSTTYGRPYEDITSFSGWLREFLNAADPSRKWEVINAGGISYASYRIFALMKELVLYEPDMFIIYTGHNEFLEKRTYGGIMNMPEILLRATEIFGRTRIYGILDAGIGEIRGNHKKTDRFVLKAEVDEILNHTVGPSSYVRDDPQKEQIIRHFKGNLLRMVRMARGAGIDVILVNPPANLKDMSPFKSENGKELEEKTLNEWNLLYRRGFELAGRGNYTEALAGFNRALELDDRHADLWYRKGRALLHLKRFKEAEKAFVRAKEEDICPLRILSPMQDSVKGIAREENVALVDFVELLDGKMNRERGYAIPGKEYFLDHVHLTVNANKILALALFDKLVSRRILSPDNSWNGEKIKRISRRIESGIDPKLKARSLRSLSKVLQWAGKFGESDMLFLLAHEGLDADPENLSKITSAVSMDGDVNEEIAYFKKLVKTGDRNRRSVYHKILGTLYEKKGMLDEATREYETCLRIVKNDISKYSVKAVVDELNRLDLLTEQQKKDYHISNEIRTALLFISVNESLARIMSWQQKRSVAIEYLKAILRLKPTGGIYLEKIGSLLVQEGRFGEALPYLKKAVRGNPKSARIHNELAISFEWQNDPDNAEKHYQKSIQFLPDSPLPYNNLGAFYARQKKMDRAIEMFSKALEIDPTDQNARRNLELARKQPEPVGQ